MTRTHRFVLQIKLIMLLLYTYILKYVLTKHGAKRGRFHLCHITFHWIVHPFKEIPDKPYQLILNSINWIFFFLKVQLKISTEIDFFDGIP